MTERESFQGKRTMRVPSINFIRLEMDTPDGRNWQWPSRENVRFAY